MEKNESMDSHPIDFLELLNGQVQYVVPRWQRRYCWSKSDIERLVEDLLVVAEAGPHAVHYGGTLLTFPEPGAAGVVTTRRVVDGQQRLTTASVLLACIAEKLGPEGQCGEWTAQIIRDGRLTNPGMRPEKHRKLRLQDGDEDEYRQGLDGSPAGAGAVTQAWGIARRLVARHDTALLLRGLERLRVVSIGLDNKEDPQQIFESLNATGRPLTESEKIKNWLLMGLPDAEQQDLHDTYWCRMVKSLGSEHGTERIDTFLRDVLRWWTGQIQGIDRVYEGFRRWAVRSEMDRPTLCRDLARLAGLYGIITGAAGEHRNAKVKRELRHLRALGIHVHRPLTLRLLNDADKTDHAGHGDAALAETLAGIGAWTTRMWLAARPTAGMNQACADLAHELGPGADADVPGYWLESIRRLRNRRAAVPGDEDVRQGIRNRKAYGGGLTESTFAVLCELMEAEHREEAPARASLTVEHVMPQKLTDDWRRDLGDGAEEMHGRYRDRLGNLTLSGDATNAGMGANAFAAKRAVYAKSPIGMTRRLADESTWNEETLERRADDLASRALARWPWVDRAARRGEASGRAAKFRWRIGDGSWKDEAVASRMVLDVAAALLSLDPANAQRLSGDTISPNVHSARRYPPGTVAGTRIMHAVPGHEAYVLHPFEQDASASAKRCQKMGERCGVSIEVAFEEDGTVPAFWQFLRRHTGGVPGQKDSWRGPNQWSEPLNARGDRIGIHIGNEERLWLYIRAGDFKASDERTARMRACSRAILDRMGDQQLGEDGLETEAAEGRSITAAMSWIRDDRDVWPDAAQWIGDQFERLRTILA